MLTPPNISVIVPFYNVGSYIEECIKSILLANLTIEIILVNDGSTDESLCIAKKYASIYNNIILLNQKHSGPSVARNKGLNIASGEYISFIDSDDWIANDSLEKLFKDAKCNNADMALGKMQYYQDNETIDIISLPDDVNKRVFTGGVFFTTLMRYRIYYPMACSYIYKREWIKKHSLMFEKHILHEDELWTQIALCYAKRVVASYDFDFYYYRKREGSIMNTDNYHDRAKSIFYIVDKLIKFADIYEFSNNNDKELKSWIYVNIARLYSQIFSILASNNDSSIELPTHTHIEYIIKHLKQMTEVAGDICQKMCITAESNLVKCIEWRNKPYNNQFSTNSALIGTKKIILFYNNSKIHKDSLSRWNTLPNNYILTDDLKYYSDADIVIFDLHNLADSLKQDIDKLSHHIWVNWTLECKAKYPILENKQILSLFDVNINYTEDADIIDPLYKNIHLSDLQSNYVPNKNADVCILNYDKINDVKCKNYIDDLMLHVDTVRLNKNHANKGDGNVISMYKFLIVFEDIIAKDYVTDTIYSSLLEGTVPIYLGAPNIDNYVPDESCYINVQNYPSPQILAKHINHCLANDSEYIQYHKWRANKCNNTFYDKIDAIKTPTIVRLCEYIDTLTPTKN